MKALMILENGFEDNEALCTYDVLKRSGIDVETCSFYKNDLISQSGHNIKSKLLFNNINLDVYDFLIIPGGKAVFQVLDKEEKVNEVIDYFYNKNKLIASICAAPMLIGKRGYFDSLTYTCFPGCEEKIIKGKKGKDGVIESGNFITATSMYYSIEFALKIIERMQGKDQAKKVKNSLMGKK